MFGCEHGAATSRTGLQRLGKDDPRHPSRDEDLPIDNVPEYKRNKTPLNRPIMQKLGSGVIPTQDVDRLEFDWGKIISSASLRLLKPSGSVSASPSWPSGKGMHGTIIPARNRSFMLSLGKGNRW